MLAFAVCVYVHSYSYAKYISPSTVQKNCHGWLWQCKYTCMYAFTVSNLIIAVIKNRGSCVYVPGLMSLMVFNMTPVSQGCLRGKSGCAKHLSGACKGHVKGLSRVCQGLSGISQCQSPLAVLD